MLSSETGNTFACISVDAINTRSPVPARVGVALVHIDFTVPP